MNLPVADGSNEKTALPESSEDDSAVEDSTSRRRVVYGLLIALSVGAMTAGVINASPLQSANDRSRWCTVYALVEQGRYAIDDIVDRPGWETIDKVRHEGHFYSTKPALLPTLIAGLCWMIQLVTGWSLDEETAWLARTILIIINVIPMAIALVVLANIVERYAKTDLARFVVIGTASLGTFLTTFSVTLNNHTIAAVSVVFAIQPAMRIVIDGRKEWWRYSLAGFFAAWTCVNELPAAAFGLALFLILAFHDLRRTLLFFVPAALVPLAGFFITTYLSTGGWKPFYMYYGTEKYEYVDEGVPSYWTNPTGLDRSVDSTAVYLLHCTVGHHGIWSLSPIFLFTLAAWCWPRLWWKDRLRMPILLGGALTALVIAFYLTRTANYNYGGNTAGLRWTFWLIPFWLVAMIPIIDRLHNRFWLQSVLAACLLVSVFSALKPLPNPWQPPWLFTLMDQWGWLDQYHEAPEPFGRPLTTWFPILPEAGNREWVELSGVDADGRPQRLRLESTGRVEQDWIELQLTYPSRSEPLRFFVDVAEFDAGAEPAEFLRWTGDAASETERARVAVLLTGLPRPAEYQPGPIRYLKTPLRDDAFQCQRAASRTWSARAEDGRIHRVDLWLCPEIPFGIAKIETTVYDAITGSVVARRTLEATAASPVEW